MGTPVIPGRNTPPALQSAESIFNKMLLIQRAVKGKYFISVFSVWRRPSSLWLSEIRSTTLRHSFRLLETYRYRGAEDDSTLVVADLPFSQQKQDGPPMPVTNDMEFGIQATFCSTGETWRIPFLSRLTAVR